LGKPPAAPPDGCKLRREAPHINQKPEFRDIRQNLVIPAKAGIQERIFRRNAPLFFDLPPFGREKTNWIPAFAGMTEVLMWSGW
jgi:hypothetical protein